MSIPSSDTTISTTQECACHGNDVRAETNNNDNDVFMTFVSTSTVLLPLAIVIPDSASKAVKGTELELLVSVSVLQPIVLHHTIIAFSKLMLKAANNTRQHTSSHAHFKSKVAVQEKKRQPVKDPEINKDKEVNFKLGTQTQFSLTLSYVV